MTSHHISDQLRAIENEPEFKTLAYELSEGWTAAGLGSESVDPILQFMEDHPTLDVGSPGPLVHFAERFYRAGYEGKLLASLARKPVPHTVWMLNRLINGANEPERANLVNALMDVLQHPSADQDARARAKEFLEFQDLWRN